MDVVAPTVRCPECDTTYRVPPRAALGARPTFRCSRCDCVFAADGVTKGPGAPESPGAAAERPDADVEDTAAVRATGRVRSPTRFALRALAGVTLVFVLLSIYLVVHRGRVAELLAQVPVVGPDLAATRLNPSHIQLTDVRGEYARVAGDALAFVITGSAVNNAPVPVSTVEIAGRIAGADDRRRTVFAGAAPRDVHGLSEREIDLLQTLRPADDWRLLPGEDGDFLIAFVDPPQPLQEFSVEVAAVRRRRRPSTE